jgi:predicted DNA binding CopG/RHH family protein
MNKKIPKFSSEVRERDFWATAESGDYVDWSKARRTVLPELKPSLKTISLRLPDLLLAEIKLLANKRDVPYQSLLKVFLAERVSQELRASRVGRSRSSSASQRRGAATRR